MNEEALTRILEELLEDYRSYQSIEKFYGQESIVFDGNEPALIRHYAIRIKEEGN